MAILITGGAGFIGSSLTSFLKKKNYDTVLFEGDISDEESIKNFSTDKKIEAVIHLAAVVNKKSEKFFERVNVEGTKNIIELCRKVKTERILFLSTIRVFSSLGDYYSDSKQKAEKIVVDSEVPYVVIRPSMVYGPGDRKNIGFLLKLVRSLPVAPVLNFRIQPVFIEDLVQVITSCLDVSVNNTFDIVGTETVSFSDLLAIMKTLGNKFKTVNMPQFFSFVLKTFSLLPFSPLPYWQVKGLLSNEVFEGDDWGKLFDIKPTSFSEGLAKTIKQA